MTEQQIFNKVAKHLLTQKKKAQYKRECVYRGDNGLKCAVGCLIPNKKYNPEMETYNLNHWSFDRILDHIGLLGHKELLRFLQKVHDYNHPRSWKYQLEEVAFAYKLDTKILDKF